MQCQGPAKPDVKKNSKKFQPGPELGHPAPQEQGEGEGTHVGEPGGHGSLTFLEFFEGPNIQGSYFIITRNITLNFLIFMLIETN